MKKPNLLLYKKSAYEIYFLAQQSSVDLKQALMSKKNLQRFINAHKEHYDSLAQIERLLNFFSIPYQKQLRGKKIDYAPYKMIFSVGGDGTFLEAAHHIKKQILIGINSSPTFSVGKLCATTAGKFEKFLTLLTSNKKQISFFNRIELISNNERIQCLNDILIANKNPAAISRYQIKINDHCEHHLSSGIWISSPTGSSGAIKSAGGKIFAPDAMNFQYKPRELYNGKLPTYQFRGGILNDQETIEITSLMRSGMIFIDGTHISRPFPYGSKIRVKFSNHPIKTILLKK